MTIDLSKPRQLMRLNIPREDVIRLYCLCKKTQGYSDVADRLLARLAANERPRRARERDLAAEIEEWGYGR